MGVFYNKEQQPNQQHQSKRCKCMTETLKELFSLCQTFGGRLSNASLEEEYPMSDIEEELEVVVSAVISRVMEKQKQKPSVLRHSFSWLYSPVTNEVMYVTAAPSQEKVVVVEGDDDNNQEQYEHSEEFLSVKSCFSCCGSSTGGEAFYSVKTSLSRCSSLKEVVDMSKYWKRSVIEELCHCEGWPFGLCRRAVLLPPLPKSPSESWLSRKLRTTNNNNKKLIKVNPEL
ncbi:hypothetical protein PIB30_013411 [Stylosanthes scabra]|uniref:Uncharacterized protein n=1 Tax=Stylosanthes scabra TaxID=79078 RepID=A0ABU6X5Z4_9FABA|nr:hypothetical protein [Stylosanthes scabra]